ncbi:MAG: helix-turn-helix domain-containing protein [archaeon]|nr:helix-turn-helix domain-containing protein [archaeon]
MQTVDEIETSLRETFKLSSYETKSYLSLLKLGKQTPKELASSASVPLPRIYDTLESLMSKGFALKQDEYYSPIPPKTALHGRSVQFETEFAKEQRMRQSVEKELASFLEKTSGAQTRQRAQDEGEISVLKGFNSIANKFSELLRESSEIILVAKRAVEAKEVFIPILLEFGAGSGSKSRKKSIRIIVPKDTKITEEELKEARRAPAEIRKSDQILFDMMITDQNDVLIGVPDPLSDEINHAIAIWFRNSSFARSTRVAVEEVWKSSQKI